MIITVSCLIDPKLSVDSWKYRIFLAEFFQRSRAFPESKKLFPPILFLSWPSHSYLGHPPYSIGKAGVQNLDLKDTSLGHWPCTCTFKFAIAGLPTFLTHSRDNNLDMTQCYAIPDHYTMHVYSVVVTFSFHQYAGIVSLMKAHLLIIIKH